MLDALVFGYFVPTNKEKKMARSNKMVYSVKQSSTYNLAMVPCVHNGEGAVFDEFHFETKGRVISDLGAIRRNIFIILYCSQYASNGKPCLANTLDHD